MCAQHGHGQEVQVLWGSRSQRPQSEPQGEPQGTGREDGAGGSGERTDALTNRHRIRGQASQGERACTREAFATKGPQGKSGDGVGKVHDPYLGRSRLTPERATPEGGARSQPRPE